jgi:hypothetical protein
MILFLVAGEFTVPNNQTGKQPTSYVMLTPTFLLKDARGYV